MLDDRAIEFTKTNEGYRQFAYQCSANKTTIGIGFNLEDVGLSEEESMVILKMRMRKLHDQLSNKLDWFSDLTEARKAALCDMAYQMGINGLMRFKKSLACMADKHYHDAAEEFKNSRWYGQTPGRANEVCFMIEMGVF